MRHRLTVAAAPRNAGDVAAPERAARAERLDHAFQRSREIAVGVRFGREAGQGGDLDVDVGMTREGGDPLGSSDGLFVCRGARKAHVIDDQFEAGMTCRYLADL